MSELFYFMLRGWGFRLALASLPTGRHALGLRCPGWRQTLRALRFVGARLIFCQRKLTKNLSHCHPFDPLQKSKIKQARRMSGLFYFMLRGWGSNPRPIGYTYPKVS